MSVGQIAECSRLTLPETRDCTLAPITRAGSGRKVMQSLLGLPTC